MYLARRTVWADDNPYYKPNGTFNLLGPDDIIQIPNCTTYAFLRAQEASEQTQRQKYWIRSSGGYGNAREWYYTTTLPKGGQPRLGAIACYDGSAGHVAIVERVYDLQHVDLSESNFSENKTLTDWHKFNYRKNVTVIPGHTTLPGTGKLIGFIYPPSVDTRTERDLTRDQVYIDPDNHNVRTGPSTDSPLVLAGSYPIEGLYNVSGEAENGGYTWLKVDRGYIALTGEMRLYRPEMALKVRLIKIREELDDIIKSI